jgi:hypothetical protein
MRTALRTTMKMTTASEGGEGEEGEDKGEEGDRKDSTRTTTTKEEVICVPVPGFRLLLFIPPKSRCNYPCVL